MNPPDTLIRVGGVEAKITARQENAGPYRVRLTLDRPVPTGDVKAVKLGDDWIGLEPGGIRVTDSAGNTAVVHFTYADRKHNGT
jgi:hypothetical protein